MTDDESDIPQSGQDYPRSSIIGGRVVGLIVLIGFCALVAWASMRAGR